MNLIIFVIFTSSTSLTDERVAAGEGIEPEPTVQKDRGPVTSRQPSDEGYNQAADGIDEVNDEIIPPKIDIATFNEDSEAKRRENEHLAEPSLDERRDGGGIGEGTKINRGRSIKNYAADSCGAKIDKQAPDLVNARYVLSSNRDQYARADCGDKLFFTVELCEIIRVDRVELASYELFSSSPKEFKLYAADAEKNEWLDLGTFAAQKFNPKASPQSFSINEQLFRRFIKYIRFEMTSYQGEEQLCTLTWFGVFGFGQYNPAPDEYQPTDGAGGSNDPVKNGLNNIYNTVRGVLFGAPGSNGTVANKTELATVEVKIIEDSYHDCWFDSAVFCYCDAACIEFIESPLFDVYVGAHVVPVREPLIENTTVSNSTEIATEAPVVEKNETKTEIPAQTKKEDPGHVLLKDQIKEFEANLSRVGDYLETLSKSYKKQMNDMRTSFNRTASRLTKVETSTRDINESILEILDMIKYLYQEVHRLDTSLERTILVASIMIGFQIIMLILWCRPRHNYQMTTQLAKIEVQLDMLKEVTEKILKEQEKAAKAPGRRNTLDARMRLNNCENKYSSSIKRKKKFKVKIDENIYINTNGYEDNVGDVEDNVFIEEAPKII